MKRFITLTVVALSITTLAYAHPQPGRAARQRHARQAAMAERLQLTQEQRERIREIRRATRNETMELRHELRADARELRKMQHKNSPEAERLEARMETLRDSLQARHEAARDRIEGVLTPEQRERIRARR